MKMPALMKKKWLAALRSGEYNQGKGALYDPITEGYCCLGVLEHVCDGNVEMYTGGPKAKAMAMPTEEWYEANGVAGLEDKQHDVFGTTTEWHLAHMNDQGKSFAEIADFIEKEVEAV